MLEFDKRHYVPILKAKMGELQALEALKRDVRSKLTPLLEIPTISWDYQNGKQAKSIDSHLSGMPERICRSWGTEHPIFLDPYMVEDETMSDGREPIAYLFSECYKLSIRAIPVIGLNSYEEDRAAISDFLKDGDGDCCIRLTVDDLGDEDEMQVAIDSLLSELGTSVEKTHLVADYGAIQDNVRNHIQVTLKRTLNEIPYIKQWKTLTFAGSGFPKDLSDVEPESLVAILRSEWILWQHLAMKGKSPQRMPTFGDYGIAHPEVSEVDPRLMRMSPNIRYTDDDAWIVAKGKAISRKKDTKKNPPAREQYPKLCQTIIDEGYWQGPAFSEGDRFIGECAEGSGNPGNATTWRRVGTDHHLTYVVRQIASLP